MWTVVNPWRSLDGCMKMPCDIDEYACEFLVI
ncbi:hypothetical protein BamMEX5DRAFT_6204 [Burkholderia ambifaria MEX-5]|uniref:Uncharacterized protein n=1 Tax=Burkholderia ambifaria MEX-5 TaxID=396597 RepID=B1TEI8_9BURK|nr:hypothetical protein BamMEX5DRAFT_6204 [Burkholderia ambifaria MEX-5]